jgi:E3 ubiquitin-protein ligase XBAT32/33
LSCLTALHFAAHDGFVPCVRLLLADFIPVVDLDIASSLVDGGDCTTSKHSAHHDL